jgi:hypothetical protein
MQALISADFLAQFGNREVPVRPGSSER